MSDESKNMTPSPSDEAGATCAVEAGMAAAEHELKRLKKDWWWFLLLGVLLAVCGTIAIAYPCVSSLAAVIVLGAALVVGGVATIVSAFWAGKWSAMLLQLLVGILYTMAGIVIMDTPKESVVLLTLVVAAFFIVVGVFRTVSALMLRFPQWGWALLNGVLTTLVGIIIYKHFPAAAIWVIGLLVGIEMIFNGWTWIMLSVTIRRLPEEGEGEEAPAAAPAEE